MRLCWLATVIIVQEQRPAGKHAALQASNCGGGSCTMPMAIISLAQRQRLLASAWQSAG
jgi:hypothetical protein